MTRTELKTGVALAGIFATRMLGLFLLLPVFAISAQAYEGGDNVLLVGLTLGVYGLAQAFFQLPFGMASDRFGRKPIILAGLVLFALGSFIAAAATDIQTVFIGRTLQGAGAISAAVTALAADLTREAHRSKVMAIIGATIALSFAISLVGAPLLDSLVGLPGIFVITGVLALLAIFILYAFVPNTATKKHARNIATPGLRSVIADPQLLRLTAGVFVLHLIQTSLFVVLPGALALTGDLSLSSHGYIYLPVVLGSFVLMTPVLLIAEPRWGSKAVLLGAQSLLILGLAGFWLGWDQFPVLIAALLIFFTAFSLLEASLPSLVSRFSPPSAVGAALGVYNTAQSLGLFVGGALGGLLAAHFGATAVLWMDILAALLWLAIAFTMSAIPKKNKPGPDLNNSKPATSKTSQAHHL